MAEREDELDHALDRALASYSEVPASAGLEQRVLAHVDRRIRQRKIWQRTAFGAIAAAAMVCVIFWPGRSPNSGESATAVAVDTAPALPMPMAPERKLEVLWASAPKRMRVARKLSEPKLPQFPTPYPLTKEERALMRLVRFEAEKEPKEVAPLGVPIKPIEIAAVEIKPLKKLPD